MDRTHQVAVAILPTLGIDHDAQMKKNGQMQGRGMFIEREIGRIVIGLGRPDERESRKTLIPATRDFVRGHPVHLHAIKRNE